MSERFGVKKFARVTVLASALTALTPLFLVTTVASASATTTASVPANRQNSLFGGYYNDLQISPPSSMSAQVTFDVPTLTCKNPNSTNLKILYIQQDLELGSGGYADGMVMAQCNGGTASYSIGGNVCDGSGCGGCTTTGCGSGCEGSPSLTVAAGSSVSISLAAEQGDDGPLEVTVNGDDSGFQCSQIGTFPVDETVFTGICGQDVHGGGMPDLAKTPPTPDGEPCQGGRRPRFSPVNFTGATINGKPLNTNRYDPVAYNLVSGTTVQAETGALSSNGESFTMTFEHP